MERLRVWSPRLLALAFAAFLALFALDVFAEGYGPWETVAALLMHLIPSLAVLAALAVAWRRERLGGALFLVLGAAYLLMSRVQLSGLIIVAPAALIGVLFLVAAARGRRTRVRA